MAGRALHLHCALLAQVAAVHSVLSASCAAQAMQVLLASCCPRMWCSAHQSCHKQNRPKKEKEQEQLLPTLHSVQPNRSHISGTGWLSEILMGKEAAEAMPHRPSLSPFRGGVKQAADLPSSMHSQ